MTEVNNSEHTLENIILLQPTDNLKELQTILRDKLVWNLILIGLFKCKRMLTLVKHCISLSRFLLHYIHQQNYFSR